jgi:alcohol dehydrogenase
MKIRAAVLHAMGVPPPYSESKPISIETVELDDPGQGEVLVKMAAAGLCHSDLSIINGDRPRPLPMVIGHEAAGIVEKCGPAVDDLKPGDHVALVFMPSCGRCVPCAEGRPALCDPGLAANIAGTLISGARRLKRNVLGFGPLFKLFRCHGGPPQQHPAHDNVAHGLKIREGMCKSGFDIRRNNGLGQR